MSTFDRLADLPVTVEGYSLEGLRAEVSSGFERLSTVVHLHGEGHTGVGEDVVYDGVDQEALQAAGPVHDLAGAYALGELCERVDGLDLFGVAPQREVSRLYRRWTFHSAALDLALRQADRPLHEVLGREPRPLTFVVSLRLGEPPSLDPLTHRLGPYPTLRFKLDPTSSWTSELIAALVDTGAVDSVDFKSLYRGTVVDQPPDPVLYDRVVTAFPAAWIEDPDVVTPETAAVLEPHHDRITWDAPIHSIDDIESLPFPPRDGQPQALPDRRAEEALRHVRLLRRARDRRLRRRPVRARPRPWPGAVPRFAVPSRHAERPRAGRLQRERAARRSAIEPVGAAAVAGRVPLE